MKTYEYKGLLVRVPDEVNFIAIGSDGVLRGYTENPVDLDEVGLLEDNNLAKPIVLNWEKTVIETVHLKEFAPVVLYETASPGTEPYAKGDKYTIQSKVDEERCLNSEVHIVVSCYTPGSKPWTQILNVKVNGLSIDNSLLSIVVDILYDLQAA